MGNIIRTNTYMNNKTFDKNNDIAYDEFIKKAAYLDDDEVYFTDHFVLLFELI